MSGRSSTMPQKRNPARSALARACARLAGAHASVTTGGLRARARARRRGVASGWEALSGALAYAGGALSAVADALESLEVDTDRMRRARRDRGPRARRAHLVPLAGAAESKRGAEVVSGAAARAADSGTSFRDELLADPRTGSDPSELEAALDSAGYLGSAERSSTARSRYGASREPSGVDA